jgi:hydrogenase expression/formation protein HypE
MKKNTHILLGHGSGGSLSHQLIRQIFVIAFKNPILDQQGDAALLSLASGRLAFTTDSYVVDPLFFPGGDIGKLAVAGTVNDLSVAGAVPLFISAAFIIEEGFSIETLEKVVQSMAAEAKKAGVQIVTGDTKVVERGKCDKLFINTAGVGEITVSHAKEKGIHQIKIGDKLILNGSLGDHGMAVMAARNALNLHAPIDSDCASLNHLIQAVQPNEALHFMRDATRGGLATVVAELCEGQKFGIKLIEDQIPVKESVRGICELLGFDPLCVANEGKVLMVVDAIYAEDVLQQLKKNPLGKDAAIIGEIVGEHPSKAWLQTTYGGNRMVDMLAGEQLPRIC